MTALFFLVLAALLVVLAAQIQIHDGNYAGFYLGLGVWLECLYLTLHFALKAILISRNGLAERISNVLGLMLMLPLGLIILILIVLLQGWIGNSRRYEQEVQITNWVFASLVLFLLVVPAVLICRSMVASFLKRRAEQALGADSP